MRTQIGREQDIVGGKPVVRPKSNMRSDREHRTCGISEDELRGRAEQEALQTATSMCAHHHQVDSMFVDPARERGLYGSAGEQRGPGYLVISRQLFEFLPAVINHFVDNVR